MLSGAKEVALKLNFLRLGRAEKQPPNRIFRRALQMLAHGSNRLLTVAMTKCLENQNVILDRSEMVLKTDPELSGQLLLDQPRSSRQLSGEDGVDNPPRD
jgi:hypothetical protein